MHPVHWFCYTLALESIDVHQAIHCICSIFLFLTTRTSLQSSGLRMYVPVVVLESVAYSNIAEKYLKTTPFGGQLVAYYFMELGIELHAMVQIISGAACIPGKLLFEGSA